MKVSNSGVAVVVVDGIYEAEPGWVDVLTGIAEQRWPDGFVNGQVGMNLFDYLPEGLEEFCTGASEEQRRVSLDVVNLFRWGFFSDTWSGKRSSTASISELWSLDGKEWNPLPHRLNLSARLLSDSPYLSPTVEKSLSELALAGHREPLGREIWHSAVSGSANGDSRIAIVLAVSAVEIELKRFISTSVPAAEWLVANLPAPPVMRIIKDYLPLLPSVDQSLLPPKSVRSVLHSAIEMRNDLLHSGRGYRSKDRLDDASVLRATSDMLWLIDAYLGHSWALEYLSGTARDELNIS